MFQAFTSFVESATQKAKELTEASVDLVQQTGYLDLEKGYNVEEESANITNGTQEQVATASDVSQPSDGTNWQFVATYIPPQLRAAEAEWREFIGGILADENTFCVPLDILIDDEHAMGRLHALCGVNREALIKIVEEVDGLAIDPKVMLETLSLFPSTDNVRFQVVPKYVVEDNFWKYLLGRCRVYHRCPSVSAVLDVMDILHQETRSYPVDPSAPEGSSAVRKYGYGSKTNSADLQTIRDTVRAKTIFTQWFESKRNVARSEIQTALGSLQLLQNLLLKREVSELADSVRESCKYRKAKIASLLGELQGASLKLVDTDLSVENGETYQDLVKLNIQLHDAIHAYQALKERDVNGDDTAVIAAASPLLASPTQDESNASSWVQVSSRSDVAAAGGHANDASPSTFTAELPWEDDEDD